MHTTGSTREGIHSAMSVLQHVIRLGRAGIRRGKHAVSDANRGLRLGTCEMGLTVHCAINDQHSTHCAHRGLLQKKKALMYVLRTPYCTVLYTAGAVTLRLGWTGLDVPRPRRTGPECEGQTSEALTVFTVLRSLPCMKRHSNYAYEQGHRRPREGSRLLYIRAVLRTTYNTQKGMLQAGRVGFNARTLASVNQGELYGNRVCRCGNYMYIQVKYCTE